MAGLSLPGLSNTSQDEHSVVPSKKPKPDAKTRWNEDDFDERSTPGDTWLDSSVSDGEVNISGYVTYRKDRGGRGGGVLVYVTDKCRSKTRKDLEEDGTEVVWVEVRMNQRGLLLGNM